VAVDQVKEISYKLERQYLRVLAFARQILRQTFAGQSFAHS
jgi:hypothetical protein